MLFPKLDYADPQDMGFNPTKLFLVDDQISQDVHNGFPGAGIIIVKDSKIIKQAVYGYKRKYNDAGILLPISEFDPITKDTLFDLASNTKMYAINYALMHLVFQHKLNLNHPISKYIPEYSGCDVNGQCRGDRRVINLLRHDAGYMADPQFFNPQAIGPELFSQNRELTQHIINTKLPFERPLGLKPVYSDVDFMLLGMIIERITQQRLDQYVADVFYTPLGLKHTTYAPLRNGFNKSDCAAGEINGNTRGFSVDFPNIRSSVIQAQVHDEKTFYSMDEVAGHAGLFSTLEDMAVLTQLILNHGRYGNLQFWNQKIQAQFVAPHPLDSSFGLGWRRAGDSNNRIMAWFGSYASELAIGHSGWVGTVTVIDPKYNLAIILLTNKKHSSCINGVFMGDNYATGQYTKIITLVYEALLTKDNLTPELALW
ncbi:MAG: penicillin binding protein PBP4B [Burkholderiales bacterium]|nr:penicillin binding protein PBP4B [Burkholderiales bacterium]